REALAIHDEDVAANRALGAHGAPLLEDGATVLTHCNAGALATAGHGTALAIVRAAVEAGKRIQVIACETRPFLQGARLTAWELKKDRIPVTLITDNMAGHLMQRGRVSCVIVGTDRTAANGDVANKIGTYPLDELVTGSVTQRGVARQPLGRTLPRLVQGAAAEAKPERKAEARRVRARRR